MASVGIIDASSLLEQRAGRESVASAAELRPGGPGEGADPTARVAEASPTGVRPLGAASFSKCSSLGSELRQKHENLLPFGSQPRCAYFLAASQTPLKVLTTSAYRWSEVDAFPIQLGTN